MGRKKNRNTRKKQYKRDAASSTDTYRHVGASTFNRDKHRQWQGRGTFGAAGPCRRIDPETGEVIGEVHSPDQREG